MLWFWTLVLGAIVFGALLAWQYATIINRRSENKRVHPAHYVAASVSAVTALLMLALAVVSVDLVLGRARGSNAAESEAGEQQDQEQPPEPLLPGDRAVVTMNTGIAKTEKNFVEMMNAVRAQDERRLLELLTERRTASLTKGTVCLVLDTDIDWHGALRVQVLSGEYEGVVGYVQDVRLDKVD